MSRIDEIRARLDAATPGPWRIASSGHLGYEDDCIAAGEDYIIEPQDEQGGQSWCYDEDAELIAHAPEDLRALLAVAEAARIFADGWRDGDDPDVSGIEDALAALDGAR